MMENHLHEVQVLGLKYIKCIGSPCWWSLQHAPTL